MLEIVGSFKSGWSNLSSDPLRIKRTSTEIIRIDEMSAWNCFNLFGLGEIFVNLVVKSPKESLKTPEKILKAVLGGIVFHKSVFKPWRKYHHI